MHNSLYGVFTKQSCEKTLICQHLARLLSTKKGSLVHLPEYGLPDVLSVFRHLPNSLCGFMRSMQETIEWYEPRLKNLKITCSDQCKIKGDLVLAITADYNMTALKFYANINYHSKTRVALHESG